MPTRKTKPSSSSERRNWDNIFNLLVQMVRKQQNQLQSLATQHKFLEDRFKMQHEAWESDIRSHNTQISMMNGILIFEEKKRLVEALKSDMVMGYKHRDASVLKWILEETEDELADFKACFGCLSSKSSNGEDQETVAKDSNKRKKVAFKDSDKRKKGITGSESKSTWSDAEEEKCSKIMKDELRRLRAECEKLSLEKSSEVQAILAEKKFVWNQYNIMENDYTNKLRTKQAEIEKSSERIKILVSSMEQLQSENSKKDSTIAQLESKVADMEAAEKKLKEEILGLSVELGSLRKSRNNQGTPVLNRCMEGTKTSDSGVSKSSSRRRRISFKKEISTPDAPVPVPANLSEKRNKGLKRKESPAIPISETPKLFSSSFKVPKLKSSLRIR
ncbi:hypothetical protein Lal_00038908 [Lupinus albus]|uniref:Uncharacterized protein n=1 Tax=Lupinus albus TaxID=3870 RepID=A0A6A4NV35_LUPAL|nr:hypothetical protein Lalb_Chr20g0120221 [Lupinus albus]KAF1882262.1 hypothetical protein Lal_00038908 [Lupinus albus]